MSRFRCQICGEPVYPSLEGNFGWVHRLHDDSDEEYPDYEEVFCTIHEEDFDTEKYHDIILQRDGRYILAVEVEVVNNFGDLASEFLPPPPPEMKLIMKRGYKPPPPAPVRRRRPTQSRLRRVVRRRRRR